MFYNSYRTTKAANAERLKLGQTGKSVISNPKICPAFFTASFLIKYLFTK